MSATAENKEGQCAWTLTVYPDGYEIYYGSENDYGPPKPKLVTLENGNFAHIQAHYNGFTVYEYLPENLLANRMLAKIQVELGLAPCIETYHSCESPPIKLAADITLIPDIIEMGEGGSGHWWPT